MVKINIVYRNACHPIRSVTNRTPTTRSSDFVNHSNDYRLNWTPLGPITIINYSRVPRSSLILLLLLFTNYCLLTLFTLLQFGVTGSSSSIVVI